MKKERKIVIIGDSAFAEIAFEYFSHDSEYDVVGFSVEKEYLKRDSLFGLSIVPFEDIDNIWAPAEHSFFAAATYTQSNRLRTRLYEQAKEKGYRPASYVSSRAFVWRNCEIGEHCFIFEDNTVQPFVAIGRNNVLWSGNHIGHHSKIKDNCFISSHVVISGFCEIGDYCFMGVNSTIANNVSVGNNCLIGAGALVLGDVDDNQTVVGMWRKRQPGSGK
jgi:sugar O-acyltransferase (sialic acid O-acetyltransferase NeuD family)